MRISDYALNRLNLLKAIRRWGPISRTDLAKNTGLSGGSITQLTSELLKKGLIIEEREVTKRNGRPRTFLQINADGNLSIASSLAGIGELDISFIDLIGNRLHAIECRIGMQPTLADMAEKIGESLECAMKSRPIEVSRVSQICITLPALIDSSKGEVHFMTTFPIEAPVAFAGPISNRLHLPVTIENDMDCMARAEHWFGRARDLDTFTLIHVGFTIGSAQYENGLPKSGANGLNAELGHVKVEFGNGARRCLCGGRGCLAAYASMYGILRAADELAGVSFPPTKSLDARFERFMAHTGSDEAVASKALEQAGAYLGVAIANLVNATVPGNVLITFANRHFMTALAAPMNSALKANIMPGVLPATMIESLVADPHWRWKGTAALALERSYLAAP